MAELPPAIARPSTPTAAADGETSHSDALAPASTSGGEGSPSSSTHSSAHPARQSADQQPAFDPTNPSSQLLSRPTDPRQDPSTPLPNPSGRGHGPSRFGAFGSGGLVAEPAPPGGERVDMGKSWQPPKRQPQEGREKAGSKSMFGAMGGQFGGGGNQGFMQMINALAQNRDDAGDSDSDSDASDHHSLHEHHHRSASPSGAGYASTSDSQVSDSADEEELEHQGGHRGTGQLSQGKPGLRDDPGEPFKIQRTASPLPSSSAASASTADPSSSATTDSSSGGEPPFFLSPTVASQPRPSRSLSSSTHRPRPRASTSSSLHAIHRPIAARRRTITGEAGEAAADNEGEYVPQGGASTEGADLSADAETEESDAERAGDVDQSHRRPERATSRPENRTRSSTYKSGKSAKSVKRREQLASKLEEIFGLDTKEEVVAEFPCWLFRSILLQGFLFCTTGHLAFYAYLQPREGKTLRSGALSARGNKTRRYYKHWFVLKDDVLSWFPSSTDPYFPDGVVDLHYCTSVESSQKHKLHFKVATAEKRWHFSADSEASRDEWVKTLKKAVFRCQNEGESVKIAIPLETIIDIERSSNLEFAETIRIRVYDADEGYSIDEYWLSYFSDLDLALEKMVEVLEQWRRDHPGERIVGEGEREGVKDTTEHGAETLEEGDEKEAEARRGSLSEGVPNPAQVGKAIMSTIRSSSPSGAARSSGTSKHSKTSSWSSSLSSRLRLFPSHHSSATTITPSSASTAPQAPHDRLSASAATLKEDPSRRSGVTTPRLTGDEEPTSRSSLDALRPTPTDPSLDPALSIHSDDSRHHYPPSPSANAPSSSSHHSSWNPVSAVSHLPSVNVSGWLKGSGKLISGAAGTAVGGATAGGRKIVEVVSGGHSSRAQETPEEKEKRRDEMSRSVWDDETVGRAEQEELEGAEMDGQASEKVNEKFRKSFGLTEKESVLGQFPAYLFRGLPIYGKIVISTTFLCFKSSGPLAKTKMILPFSDIIGLSKHRSYRIGYSGLVIVIKGHEEVFFELSSSDRRDACLTQLEHHVEHTQQQLAEGKTPGDTKEHLEHLDLLDLAASKLSLNSLDSSGEDREKAIEQALFRTSGGDQVAHPGPENVPGQPPVMFSSTTSDFVTFRPEKSLRFTCLTIGSRGDVQPYIALCKGLMAEGHTCKIASHGEYRDWVEGHGIAFEEVGGDPAELMELMIAHDFFTISFMKEAVGRFRGWLDDLLDTTWKACQNTDVLIESPSAIAGYHVAEALRVPYYRAFTMPWSRTRAYPHAFAVPDHKMGGGYNYMTYTMFEQIFWRATSGQVNRWRRKTLGLRSTSLEAMQQHKIPFLYNFSPVVIPPPLDWRENIHVTGYWWLDNPDDSEGSKWEPPKDLLEWLDEAKSKSKKVVFVGFGSIIIPDPVEMTRVVSEAVEKADVYAIVAKGWSDRNKSKDDTEKEKKDAEEKEEQEAKLMHKEFIYNIKSIPHDWLFPRIAAAVHHGGAGTTGASLRAGLPTIIKPFFGDQHFYADRVATLGIGSAVREMTVDNLAEAIITAVSDEKQIGKAKLAGETIRKEDGVGTAIECIYRDLEYARSLIPPPTPKDTALPAVDEAPPAPTPSSESTTVAPDPPRPTTPSASEPQPSSTSSPAPNQHHRSVSSSRTNPSSSDEGGWDVVSSSASAVSGPGESERDSTRWENDSMSAGGPESRSQSCSREEGVDDQGARDGEGKRGLTAAVLEAFKRS